MNVGHAIEEQQRLIVESATDFAIVTTDLGGFVTSWNSGAQGLLGYADEEILGRSADVIFTPEDRAVGRPETERQLALRDGRAEDERWHMRKDGSRFWGSGLLMTLKDRDGAVIGFLKIMRDRTRQHETERALRTTAQSLRLAMDAGRMAIWNLDLTTDTLAGSPELNRVLGFPPEADPSIEEIRSRYAPGERERINALSQEAFDRGERSMEFEFRYLQPDGAERWLMLRAEIQLDPAGRPARAIGVIMDIDDRKRAHLALEETEERFRLIADSAPVKLWMGDPNGKCLYLNRAQREFWGVAEEDVPSFNWTPTIHPDDIETLAAPFREAMRTHTGFTVEARYRRADGEYRILRTDAHPRFDASGDFLGMTGVNVDVTDRRRAEAALLRETRALAIVNETGAAVAAEMDLNRIVQKVTDAGRELTGAEFGAFFYNVTDESGQSLMLYALSGAEPETFAGFAMPRATLLLRPTLHGEGVVRSDDILTDPRYGRNAPNTGMPKGHLPVRSYLAVPVVSRSGEALGTLLYGHREPGRFLPEHETLLSGIAGHAAIAIDNVRLFQAKEAELAERRRAEEALQALNATLEQRVAEEVAERAKAEEVLRQTQKMEAVGQLTGGIAHDFNNLLAGIVGSLDLMQTRIRQGRTADLDRYVSAAMSSAQRAAALTHRLLAFSRRQPLDPKPVEANGLVAGMEDLLRRSLGPSIVLETALAEGLWPTLCDPVQLESALLNLCINARDAMPDGGHLLIETANAEIGEAEAAARRDLSPGQYVVIGVTDTGVGMTPEVLSRVFEPFYTTKPIGQGTGLGLSMVYGFAKQSEGHVRIHSEPGQGTKVRLYLPRHSGKPEEDDAEAIQADLPRAEAGETVLVVEDEPVVRDLVVEVLRDLGYRTLEASDSAAGLRLLQSRRRIDLLVTDVGLPGLNGRQLADQARERRPELRVLFITGYAENATLPAGFLGPGMAMLTKPFTVDALMLKIRQMIEGEAGR